MKCKNVALVLSSGGARGIAHIGVIKMLEQQGYTITSVAGTSMGALVGGIFASGQLHEFEDWLCLLDIRETLKLTDFSISSKGLVKGVKIINKIKDIVPDRNIEDLPIPFCAVATDILNGTESQFISGDLFDAIRASISIPTVFQPFKIGDHYFVDGGVLNPLPISSVKRSGDDLLVVVDVSAQTPYVKPNHNSEKQLENQYRKYLNSIQKKISTIIPKGNSDNIGMFNLTNISLGLMLSKITSLTLEKYQPDVLINISRDSFGTYDFYKAKDIIAEGERAAQDALSKM